MVAIALLARTVVSKPEGGCLLTTQLLCCFFIRMGVFNTMDFTYRSRFSLLVSRSTFPYKTTLLKSFFVH